MGGMDFFAIGFLVLAIGERLYERRYSNQAVRGERKMQWSYTALHSLLTLIYVLAAVEYFVWRRHLNWGVTATGCVLFVIAVTVRLTAIRTLGNYWSLHLEIRPEHQLITVGIYRFMRHPAYSAIMLEVIAVPLVLNSYGVLVFSLVVYVPLMLARWTREEREMVAKFGGAYEQYRREVPAFIPWFGRVKSVVATPPPK